MTRQRRMIELVIRSLTETARNAELARNGYPGKPEMAERKVRIMLACAVDEALEDLRHALSTKSCNHDACKNTVLDDGMVTS